MSAIKALVVFQLSMVSDVLIEHVLMILKFYVKFYCDDIDSIHSHATTHGSAAGRLMVAGSGGGSLLI